MAAGSKFLLFQLPQKEILETIRVMDIYQIMSFSLVSKRCKQLVHSLQMKAEYIFVRIHTSIEITVQGSVQDYMWWINLLFKNYNEDEMKKLRAPLYVELSDSHRLERIGFEYSDWLEHFQDIFHCHSIAVIEFDIESAGFDLDQIKKVFGATKQLYARHTGCYAYNSTLLQKIMPIAKLNINTDMFEGSKIPFSILQQNYATLEIECDDNTTRMTLNELLVMNSKRITISHSRISPQDLNKFIKLWMKGSNSRMEFFAIFSADGFHYDREVVMKGIKHSNERSEEMNTHRMDICRMDGTRATISFRFGGVGMLGTIMTTVSKFPLLQLPDKEILRTIRVMDIYQIMSFSLISKRCKKLVQSLQIKDRCIYVTINTNIYITIYFLGKMTNIYFKNSNKNQRKKLRAPQCVEADGHRMKRIGFEFSDWLEHFQTIFHQPSITNIGFYQGSSEYDLDEIKKVFGATNHLFARNTGRLSHNSLLLQKFLPIEKLNINPNMFQDLKIPFNILQQNYDTLDIISDHTAEISLNELLVMNSKRITTKNVRVSAQDLNKFIKLWMEGSNSRMEYLMILFLNRFQYDRTMVMKGIRKCNERREGSDLHRMDIYRMDGTRATVSFFVGGVEIIVEC